MTTECIRMSQVGDALTNHDASQYFRNGDGWQEFIGELRASDAGLAFDIEDALCDIDEWSNEVGIL